MCWFDWAEIGYGILCTRSNKLSKNNHTPQMEQRSREKEKKWEGDLTCESGDAYLHANYVARRGKREESAPQAPDRQREDETETTQQSQERNEGNERADKRQTNEGINWSR